jgi:hypothetical protein
MKWNSAVGGMFTCMIMMKLIAFKARSSSSRETAAAKGRRGHLFCDLFGRYANRPFLKVVRERPPPKTNTLALRVCFLPVCL